MKVLMFLFGLSLLSIQQLSAQTSGTVGGVATEFLGGQEDTRILSKAEAKATAKAAKAETAAAKAAAKAAKKDAKLAKAAADETARVQKEKLQAIKLQTAILNSQSKVTKMTMQADKERATLHKMNLDFEGKLAKGELSEVQIHKAKEKIKKQDLKITKLQRKISVEQNKLDKLLK